MSTTPSPPEEESRSTAAIHPAVQRIHALTPMRTDSLERLRQCLSNTSDLQLVRSNGPRDSCELAPGYGSETQRRRHLLKAAFVAWSPRQTLGTTSLIKASLSRIFLYKQRAESRASARGEETKFKPPSAKLRGTVPPEFMRPHPGERVDALDTRFKWYRSEVIRVSAKAGAALVRYADLADRFNSWIPFDSGRMAPLGTMTPADCDCPSGSSTVCGTTALIPTDTPVEVYYKDLKLWKPGHVSEVSEDGEELDVTLADGEVLHVVVDDGCVRMFTPVASPNATGRYKKATNTWSDFKFAELRVDINAHKRVLGYGEEWVQFHLHDRYSDPEFLGRGAYGCVISARDCLHDQMVAIKKISGIQNMDYIDAMRTLREIKICRHLRDHDNIVKLLNVIPQRMPGPTQELYLVFEYMPSDLSKFMRSGELAKLAPDQQSHLRQGYMYQMLCALKFMHSAGILHRDLKPSNVLVSAQGELKIADFGLAIGIAGQSHRLISYVVTRWYRAPELLLDVQDYSTGVDLWALGCIFAEMFTYKPRFPGKSSRHQLQLILQILGKPLSEDVEAMANPKFFDLLRSMEDRTPIPWSRIYPHQSATEIDLLEKLLQLNPQKRLTVDEALSHEYFEDWFEATDCPECPELFGFVTEDISTDEIDRMLKEEVGLRFENPSGCTACSECE